MGLLRDAEWRKRANCRDVPVAVFFGDAGLERERICKACSVSRECLAFVLQSERELRARHGFWAGTTAEQRRKKYGSMRGR